MVSSAQKQFATHIVDLLIPFGACKAKRMFGGYGIFHQGLMIGLISDADFYLKADKQSCDIFTQTGSTQFVYYKQQKPFHLSYYLAPEDFFEEDEATLKWAELAYDAALRVPRKTKKAKKGGEK